MWPRSEERGNAARSDGPGELVSWASMWPRSEERGNTQTQQRVIGVLTASMWPRSEERGNKVLRNVARHRQYSFNVAALRGARK